MNARPGWYPDPTEAHTERWWDGTQWSTASRPASTPLAPGGPPTSEDQTAAATINRPVNRLLIVSLIAAIAVLLIILILVLVGSGSRSPAVEPTGATIEATTPATTTTRAPATTSTLATTTTTTVPVAEYTNAFNAEAARACEVIKADPGLPTEQVMQYNPEWAKAERTFESLQRAINECAQGARDQALAKIADAEHQARLSNCPKPDPDAIVRNPDGFIGQCFKIVADISQADAATGLCAFRARWDVSQREWYEYSGDNAIFSAGDESTNCPVIDGMDEDDVVSLVVTVKGSLTYDTAIGGSMTVPKFFVERGSIISKG